MNLIKVKGIVIKEVTYKENDKIITLITDTLGKISCIARGAKKTNSPLLAGTQYLVYSDFVLYKSKNFYYVNSVESINTFYKLRVDFDKLDSIFQITRILNSVTDENQDTSDILKLFVNTIYIIDKTESIEKVKIIIATFKIKLFQFLGFTPRIDECVNCRKKLEEDVCYYDYVNNNFYCSNCLNEDKRRYIKLSKATVTAIKYVILSNVNKIFSFELKSPNDYILFGQVYCDSMTNGI